MSLFICQPGTFLLYCLLCIVDQLFHEKRVPRSSIFISQPVLSWTFSSPNPSCAMVQIIKSQDGNQRRLAPLQRKEYIVSSAASLVWYDDHRNVQQPEIGLDLPPEDFPSQSPYPAGGVNTTPSPGSDQSTGSWPSSDSGTPISSTWSGPTSLLARKRRLTPQIGTPTSSVVSSQHHDSWERAGPVRKRHESTSHQTSESLDLPIK